MGFFDNIGKMIDRYGRSRTGRGPKVKSGPSKGLTRARNKNGRWGASHKGK